MTKFSMEKTFKTLDRKRDNFLARVFGIFNEDIVRIWCNNPNSEYRDLGRPSLYENGKYKHITWDFTLQNRRGEIYVSELKSEVTFDDYKYLKLNDKKQIEDHRDKESFTKFLELAKNPQGYEIKTPKGPVSVNGAILIWGSVNPAKKQNLMNEYKFHDILSLEDMINDLIEWNDSDYKRLLSTRYEWISELFSDLHFQ